MLIPSTYRRPRRRLFSLGIFMDNPEPAPKDFHAVLETIDRLAAYDDETPDVDLRGNLDAIREQCKRILTPTCSGPAGVSPRRYLVRTNCEYAIVIEATSPDAALAEAEHLDFDKHWEKSWSEFEVEENGI